MREGKKKRKKEGGFYYLIIHVKSVIGHNEALQPRHVGVRAVPGQEEGVGLDVAQLQAVDGGQGAQLGVLDGEQIAVEDRRGFSALWSHFGASLLGRQPLAMLSQPNLLHVGLARANQRVACKRQKEFKRKVTVA